MLWGIFSLFLHRAAQSAGLCALVFFPCGEAAAYVALGLVYIQEPARLSIQRRVDVRQTLGQILMYGGLTDSELLCGGADGGLVIYDVRGKVADSFLDICTHMHHSQQLLVLEYMLGSRAICCGGAGKLILFEK